MIEIISEVINHNRDERWENKLKSLFGRHKNKN